jgi:hypothetical protein
MLIDIARRAASATPAVFRELSYITFQSQDRATASSSSFTFNNISIGNADANRYVVLAVHMFSNNASSISDVTIGGTTSTSVVELVQNSRSFAQIRLLYVPTGTTANVSVVVGAASDSCGVGVYRLITDDPTAFDTQSIAGSSNSVGTRTVSLNMGARALGVKMVYNGGSSTWTGLNEDYDVDVRTNEWASSAHINNYTSGGSLSISVTNAHPLVTASWR